MTIETLKVCPFCGKAGHVEQEEQESPSVDEWYRVVCEDCGGNSGWYMSSEMAIHAWNIRI